MKKLVVFTGAGISAESGLKTFRDSDGLWENYRLEDVATPEAWRKNRKAVLDFYNLRREQVRDAVPNAAHHAIAKLEHHYSTTVITQNIDDLHERAGSKKIIHLHGEITKARSTLNPDLVYPIGFNKIEEGNVCELGSQLRPHIVWFGEFVPELERAADIVAEAELLLVIGTSLLVYPAAGLIDYAPENCKKYFIDPKENSQVRGFELIQKTAGNGVPELVELLVHEVS